MTTGKNAILPSWHPWKMNRGSPHSVISLAVGSIRWLSCLMCKFRVPRAILHKAAATQPWSIQCQVWIQSILCPTLRSALGHVASHRDLCKYWWFPGEKENIFPLTPDLCFWIHITGVVILRQRILSISSCVSLFSGWAWALTCLWSCVSDSYEHPVWRRAIWNSQSLQIYPGV